MFAPTDVEVSGSKVYESVARKIARKKYGVGKTQRGGNHPLGSSRINLCLLYS